MQTLHPVRVSLPPPPRLSWPVPNQFLHCCCALASQQQLEYGTVGMLFGEWGHCFWVVWVWFVCFLFSANLTPGRVFVNLCSHVHLLHLMGAPLWLTILTCVVCCRQSAHSISSPRRQRFTRRAISSIHVYSIHYPFSFVLPALSSFLLVSSLSLFIFSHFPTLSWVICHWFFPLSLHLSRTLSCTLNRSLQPELQPRSGCGRGRGRAWGKVAEEGGEEGEAHTCGRLIESRQFGQCSPDLWEWSGICDSWFCLCMWNREMTHLCQRSCPRLLRIKDCRVFDCVCLFLRVNE